MKRIKVLALVLVLTLVFALTGCDDLQKESYKDDMSVVLSADPVSISAMEPEVWEIVKGYDPDGILTQAMAVYSGNDEVNAKKGTLYYTYCSSDEESGRATIVIATYDMATRTLTEVSYEEGNGIFVDAASEPVEPYSIQATFESIFEAGKNENSMANKINGHNIKLKMDFSSTGVEISIF